MNDNPNFSETNSTEDQLQEFTVAVTYNINTKCDYCEEQKPCRYIYQSTPEVDIPVLAICRDCDTNNKENDMSTTAFTDCVAITTTGQNKGSSCKNHAHQWVEVLYKGVNAYHTEALPAKYQGGGWLKVSIPVCNNHAKVLGRGNALKIQSIHHLTHPGDRFASKEEAEQYMRDHPDPLFGTKEEEMNTIDADYDREHSQREQLKLLEGAPFDIEPLKFGGKVMIERCDHEECNLVHEESMHEAQGEICCGDDDCNHFFTWLCLYHGDGSVYGAMRQNRTKPARYKVDNEWVDVPGRFSEWHRDNTYANKHVAHLRELGDIQMEFVKKARAHNGHGFWVTWNADQELADEFFAQHKRTTVTEPREATFTKKSGSGVLCGNCRKNGVENPYHDTTDEVKSCYMGK